MIFCFVSSEIYPLPLSARDTVPIPTPALIATSLILAIVSPNSYSDTGLFPLTRSGFFPRCRSVEPVPQCLITFILKHRNLQIKLKAENLSTKKQATVWIISLFLVKPSKQPPVFLSLLSYFPKTLIHAGMLCDFSGISYAPEQSQTLNRFPTRYHHPLSSV